MPRTHSCFWKSWEKASDHLWLIHLQVSISNWLWYNLSIKILEAKAKTALLIGCLGLQKAWTDLPCLRHSHQEILKREKAMVSWLIWPMEPVRFHGELCSSKGAPLTIRLVSPGSLLEANPVLLKGMCFSFLMIFFFNEDQFLKSSLNLLQLLLLFYVLGFWPQGM